MNKYIKLLLSILSIVFVTLLIYFIIYLLSLKYQSQTLYYLNQNPYTNYINQNINSINNKVKEITGISVFDNINKDQPENIVRIKKDLSTQFNLLVQQINNINTNYSIYINDLYSDKTYLYNENANYYAASLFKIPIAVATLVQVDQSNLSLQDQIIYKPYHATIGTGFINQNPANTPYTIDQLLNALLKNSDNTAQTMLEEKLDVNSNKVSSVFPNQGTTNFYYINESNSKEVGDYLNNIYTTDLLSNQSKDYFFNTMLKTQFDDYFANYITGDYANKIGLSGSSIHNCGVIIDKDIVVCMMSSNTNKNQFIQISKMVSEFLNEL